MGQASPVSVRPVSTGTSAFATEIRFVPARLTSVLLGTTREARGGEHHEHTTSSTARDGPACGPEPLRVRPGKGPAGARRPCACYFANGTRSVPATFKTTP